MARSAATTGTAGYCLGVDLGTTYTAAAIWRGGRTEIVPLGDHSPQIPSALFRTDDGEYLVGEPAVRRGASEPGRLATEFKRRVGDDTSIMLGGTPMSAHALMAQLLSWVVAKVSAGQGSPPAAVVLTCPANWGPYRRELLEQAGRMAGVGSVIICTEPSAAAVHFAATERVETGDTLAVYDLGGGTFDAAVLRKDGEADFALLGSPEGIEHLGGLDFDAAVLQHLWVTLGDIDADPDDEAVITSLSRLRRDCTEAKEALSVDTAVTIPVDLGGEHRSVRLGRDEFEELIRPALEETVAALERALGSAEVTAEELGSVLLVGGSARIPLVTELLTRRLGRPVAVSGQPKHGVALGAAMVGAQVAGLAAPKPQVTPGSAGGATPGTAASGAGAIGAGSAAHSVADRGTATQTRGADGPEAGVASTAPASAPRRLAPQSARRAALTKRGFLASAVLALLAVAAVMIGPVAPEPAVVAQLDAAREVATLTGAPVPEGAQVQLTLAGRDLPAGSGAVTAEQAVNLSGARIYAVGPLRARLSGPDGTAVDTTAQLVPPAGAPWGRLLSLPGAVMLVGLLFAFAYGESLLRPMLRRGKTAGVATLLSMAAIGAVLGVVLVIGAWLLGSRLLTPVSVVVALVCSAAAAGLLTLGLEGRLRNAPSGAARATRS